MKKRDGFTLAELLVVVSIIGILVAVSIPIFNKQMEKVRQAVDASNARIFESVLVNAMNDGTLNFSSDSDCVWVFVSQNNTGFRTNGNIKDANGKTVSSATFHDIVAEGSGLFLKGNWVNGKNANGSSEKGLFCKSRDMSLGWYWYEVYLYGDGSYGVISGTDKSRNADIKPSKGHGTTNIEKVIMNN